MKNCLIYQPCGLGDIIWLQPMVDKLISDGYTIYYPVIDLYYDLLKEQMPKENLIWVKESEDFPMKSFYGTHVLKNDGNNLYLPISFANYYLQRCSVMISKYYYMNMPISNWHKNVNIKRNTEKENRLIEAYGIDLTTPFALVNMVYGTPPNHIARAMSLSLGVNQLIHMSFEKDREYGFTLFDWIGVIEKATEIHTVETSLCYLVDMFAKSDKIFMYEKRRENEQHTYYSLVNLVYRNPNWSYLN
jgi:hypothetical protein